jgi:hypothetical protein
MEKIEKVRVKEATEEEIEDTEIRELINEIFHCV